MEPLVAHLDRLGVLPERAPATAPTPAEELVERYRVSLVEERGLAVGTVTGYVHVARLFLATRPPVPDVGLGGLLH